MTAHAAAGRRGERGYVLLALLASSAVLVATLALSLPRMAVQRQRDREQKLIDRGEQYQRAIELYFRQHNKYPEEIEDLEETDGVRYLRRRHPEPMGSTGEWRIIHMGEDGRFEDSLLHDLEKDGDAAGRTATGGLPGFGSGPSQGEAPYPVAAGPSVTVPGGPAPVAPFGLQDPRLGQGPQPLVGAARARTARESAAPDVSARDRYSQGFDFGTDNPIADSEDSSETQDRSRMLPSTIPMDENEIGAGFGPANQDPRLGAVPGGPFGFGQAPAGAAVGRGGPGLPGGGNQAGLAAGSGAAEMIHGLLTTPRSAIQPGAPSAQSPTAAQRMFERGIAGVASTSEEQGIKTYKGRQAFNEWEFVFDYREATGSAQAGAQGRQAGGSGQRDPSPGGASPRQSMRSPNGGRSRR